MPEDQAFLRAVELGPELGSRWRFRGSTPGPEQWSRSTWANSLCQFLVVSRQDGAPIGLVSLYDADFRDGIGFVAAAKFSLEDRSLKMLSGTLLFLDYVFASWRLRKVYFDVPGFNLDQFGFALRESLEVEARLKENLFAAGRYWDRYTLTLTRERWEEVRARYGPVIR